MAYAYAAIARLDWKGALEQLNAIARHAEKLRRGRESFQIYLLRALAKKPSVWPRCGAWRGYFPIPTLTFLIGQGNCTFWGPSDGGGRCV